MPLRAFEERVFGANGFTSPSVASSLEASAVVTPLSRTGLREATLPPLNFLFRSATTKSGRSANTGNVTFIASASSALARASSKRPAVMSCRACLSFSSASACAGETFLRAFAGEFAATFAEDGSTAVGSANGSSLLTGVTFVVLMSSANLPAAGTPGPRFAARAMSASTMSGRSSNKSYGAFKRSASIASWRASSIRPSPIALRAFASNALAWGRAAGDAPLLGTTAF